MFSEGSCLEDMMDSGSAYPFKESLDERARRYGQEVENKETDLTYDDWVEKVWYPKYGKL